MNNEPSGRLANPKAWSDVLPEAVFTGLVEWSEGQAFELLHRRWHTKGRNGSYLAAVQLQHDRGMLSGAILKILDKELARVESRAVRLAEERSPKAFVDAHLTKSTWIGPLPGPSGSWLHLQEVAQAGAARMLPLAELVDDAQLGRHCGAILSAIATEWNTGEDDPPPLTTTVGEFLHQELGARLESLRGFLAAAGWDVDRPGPWIQVPGRPDPLPNPLALLVSSKDTAPITVFRGHGHGDLRIGNVLIPVIDRAAEPRQFRLTDIGRYEPTRPIARDPATLLLSIAATWLPGLAPQSALRSSLAELVVAPHELQPSPPIVGYLAVAQQIDDAGAAWAVRRSLMPDWREQQSLVLAAEALRVASDDQAEADQWWFLEVGALALRPFTPTGPTPSVPLATPPTARREPALDETPTSPADLSSRGAAKLEFNRRLGADWQDLADILDIRAHERARFPQGDEPRYIWEWLEVRGQLNLLPTALTNIGRGDLAALVRSGSVPSSRGAHESSRGDGR